MKKFDSIADRLRELSKGESFVVNSESERQTALRIAKALKSTGYLPHKITTWKIGTLKEVQEELKAMKREVKGFSEEQYKIVRVERREETPNTEAQRP